MDGRVSVVIATRDRPAGLRRTLAKLSTLCPVPPVVVVDNASRHPVQLPPCFPAPLTLVALGHNRGAAGRTVGARYARTRYVAFSDDDSWWAPDALRTAADELDRDPRLALVAARTLVGAQQQPDPLNAAMADSPLSAADGAGVPVLGCLACATVVRRDAFLAVGGFSELLFLRGEETLLCYDLAAADWHLRYLDQVVAHHHPSAARPPAPHGQALQRRNSVLVAWLRRPLPVAIASTWRLARQARGDPVARAALAGLLRRLPTAVRARRRLPPEIEHAARLAEQAVGAT